MNENQEEEEDQSRSSGSPQTLISGEGKLLIKLKIPKHEVLINHEEEEDHQIEIGSEEDKNKVRVCDFCNKKFSSGKALGGHMRIHSQSSNNKEIALKKKLKSNNPQTQKLKTEAIVEYQSNNDSSKPVCSLCGKSFPSMKSLFGHMRCHPEREWRGIQPPIAKNNSSSSSVSDSIPPKSDYPKADTNGIAIDLRESLSGWSKTARRGREAIINTQTAPSSSEDEEVDEDEEDLIDVAEELMMLAQGNSLDSVLTHKHVIEESEATNSNSMTNNTQIDENMNRVFLESKKKKRKVVASRDDHSLKKLGIEERVSIGIARTSFGNPKIVDKGKGKVNYETVFSPEIATSVKNPMWGCGDSQRESNNESNNSKNSNDTVRSESMNGPIIMMVKNKKRRKKKLKISELESIQNVNSGDRYKCNTCNKSFSTHQALGGHRSSHNKVKNSNIVVEEFSNSANEFVHNTNNLNSQFDEVRESEHQCKLCNKKFPTGQALGGHKRCHWTPPNEAASSRVTSPGEESQTGPKASQAGRVVLDFDLNDPPPLMDDEGMAIAQ